MSAKPVKEEPVKVPNSGGPDVRFRAPINRGYRTSRIGESGPATGAAPEKPVAPPVTDVALLKEDDRQFLTDLIVLGARFEDILQSMLERDGRGVTAMAVANYYRANRHLQKKRVRNMIETADALKRAIGGDPDSAETRLAGAVFLTGFQCLYRKDSVLTLKDAEANRLLRENLRITQRTERFKEKESLKQLKLFEARTAHERARTAAIRKRGTQ